MFLTALTLEIEYGIDAKIAKFFVDREPPADNLYWKDKLLYLRPSPGYIFIPMIVELYYRSGLSLKALLDGFFVETLEDILDQTARQEFGLISEKEMIENCIRLVEARAENKQFLNDLVDYFRNSKGPLGSCAPAFKALRRGDVFLFSLCVLHVDENRLMELAKTWFALISVLLLMDDAEDYMEDLEAGEDNTFIESGSSKEGFNSIQELLRECLKQVASLNPTMAHTLHQKLASMSDKPGIKEYLNT